MTAPRSRFDAQAPGFDERAGVGAAAPEIAAAALALAALGPTAVVLEIGPGTGEIGCHLAAAAGRYVGLDSSRPMLHAFAARTGSHSPAPLLAEADADRQWPVRTAVVDLVFSSRASHLLDVRHLAAELTRVCRPGGHLLLGRVARDRHGLRRRLRDRRRALLADRGIVSPEGGDRTRELLAELGAAGAAPVERRPVAGWTVHTSPDRVLAQWESSATVGGGPIPGGVHNEVTTELRAWAVRELGPLERSVEEAETYILEGARLP
jgi:SAM-dependent methyltransferase